MGCVHPATPAAAAAKAAADTRVLSTARMEHSIGLVLRAGLLRRNHRRDVWRTYVQEAFLGEGLSGGVVVAKHRTIGRLVAIKTIDLAGMSDAEKADLDAEIETLTLVFEEKSRLSLVMELCTGGELYERLQMQNGDHFTEDAAAVITVKILQAVGCCHAHDVVHKDLKLENFLFESPAAVPSIRLIDFGSSRRTGQIGSPEYMAPEVAIGETAATSSCDLWSVGVILYMLLTGTAPFRGDADDDVLAAVRAGKYSLSGPRWATVRSDCKRFVSLLLSKDPRMRPTVARALREPWLAGVTSTISADDAAAVLECFRTFTTYSTLKRLALAVIAFCLTPAEVSPAVLAVFSQLDRLCQGGVTEHDFAVAVSAFCTEAEARALFHRVATSPFTLRREQPVLSYSLFVAVCLQREEFMRLDLAWTAFNRIDVQDKGFVSVDDFVRLVAVDSSVADGATASWRRALTEVGCKDARYPAANSPVMGPECFDYVDFLIILADERHHEAKRPLSSPTCDTRPANTAVVDEDDCSTPVAQRALPLRSTLAKSLTASRLSGASLPAADAAVDLTKLTPSHTGVAAVGDVGPATSTASSAVHAAATGSVEDRPAASTSVSASRAMVQTSPPAFSPLASRKELSPRGRDAAAAAATNPRAESPTMSLAKLAETLNGTFNINAVAFIAVQLITALRACHAKGWVLVDLHPSRVDVGRDGTVTIADWSSAVKYRDVVRAPKAKSLAVLAFRSAHVKTAPPSPRDDMESLAYLVVWLLAGRLPWQSETLSSRMQEMKSEALTSDALVKGLPLCVQEYWRSIVRLVGVRAPSIDYSMLAGQFYQDLPAGVVVRAGGHLTAVLGDSFVWGSRPAPSLGGVAGRSSSGSAGSAGSAYGGGGGGVGGGGDGDGQGDAAHAASGRAGASDGTRLLSSAAVTPSPTRFSASSSTSPRNHPTGASAQSPRAATRVNGLRSGGGGGGGGAGAGAGAGQSVVPTPPESPASQSSHSSVAAQSAGTASVSPSRMSSPLHRMVHFPATAAAGTGTAGTGTAGTGTGTAVAAGTTLSPRSSAAAAAAAASRAHAHASGGPVRPLAPRPLTPNVSPPLSPSAVSAPAKGVVVLTRSQPRPLRPAQTAGLAPRAGMAGSHKTPPAKHTRRRSPYFDGVDDRDFHAVASSGDGGFGDGGGGGGGDAL